MSFLDQSRNVLVCTVTEKNAAGVNKLKSDINITLMIPRAGFLVVSYLLVFSNTGLVYTYKENIPLSLN